MVVAIYFPVYSAVGFFSQTLDFDYQLVEENIYYYDGYLNNELENSTISNDHSEYGMNYLIKSKTGFHHKYFALLFEYVLAIETEKRYNQIDSNLETLNKKILSHQLNPTVFFQWKPFRLGMGYRFDIHSKSIANKQRQSIRPYDVLSFYFHIHFPELWYRSPIGLGTYYELSFNPKYSFGEIPNHLFHNAALSFHINFNYLSQFQIMFIYQRSESQITLYKVESDSNYSAVPRDFLARYYIDYSFTHQIIREMALRIGIGNLIYSSFESPVLNFNIGVTYSFFRI